MSLSAANSPAPRLGPGHFVAVTGPSGVGKDSLIAFARAAKEGHAQFVFARRTITRATDGTEPHDTMSPEEFQAAIHRGDFALTWEAHGNYYGLPASIDRDILAGRVVVANVSRQALPEIAARYANLLVVQVTAHPELVAQRLTGRGRENEEQIAQRLQRSVMQIDAAGRAVELDNSGPVAEAGQSLVSLLSELV